MILYRTVLLLILAKPFVGWAIDLQPNDIVAPLPEKRYVQITYFNTENTTYYKNGSVVSASPFASPVLDAQSVNARLIGSYTVANLPAASFVQLPYGTVKPAGSLSRSPSDTGIGDIVLATAIWPYSNTETRTYFGLAAYLTIPTGGYSSMQPFNMGGNRYTTDIQMGYQQPIIGNLDGMFAIDTMFYGGNSQCSVACLSSTNVPLNQKPVTTTQVGPIYKFNEIFTVSAQYYHVAGGATTINNAYQNNVINTQRFMLSSLMHTDIGRFSLQYGRDIGIQNGLIQNRVFILRFMKEF
ncbi:transporter [Polynucleobacter sp. CS-Odin-A6]|uniref:transporter n=1 Tax=Polynucleobacter sp. CS-Odin-A6 TaxID=2689106 RepID=UPI001C0C7287|nr:transporter [Polynucleobacter sp. CS-Odin-A6]MBU3621997.1 transporter [Polynucleobacter sp. CS-Odin-A6]